MRVQGETDCNPLIVMYHEAGCPNYFINDFTWANYWKPSLMGSVFALMGLVLGCLGLKLFSLISAFSVAICVALTSLWVIAANTTWMRDTLAFIFILLTLAVVAVVLTLLLKERKHFSVTILLLGCLSGFQAGSLLYALIYQVSKWESLVAMLTFQFVFLVIFAVFCYRERKSRAGLKLTVAMVGGITFTRGLSLFFGGYPIDSV